MHNATSRRAPLVAALSAALAWPLLAAAQHDHAAHESPDTGTGQPADDSAHAGHAEPSGHTGHGTAVGPDDPAGHAMPMDHAGHMDHAMPMDHEHADHADHEPAAAGYVPPPVTEADRAAAFPDLAGMHVEHAMLDDPLNKLVLLDRLETQNVGGTSLTRWDLESWIGHSLTKVWIRTEGERQAGPNERAELDVLWGKSFARWWELVAGARRDFEPGPTQDWAAVGVRGTAPYRFDLEATAYVGDGGRAALRVKSHYELLVTNRLILQPLAELNWYAQSDAARGIGAGLATAELGLRLRYEIRREVAPYVGLVAERKLGGTADLAHAAGYGAGDTRLVAGLRLRF
jgi:copper resistance protein B